MNWSYPSSLGRLEKPDRVIVIGDVHGCFSELMELVEKLKLTTNDLVIFLGDLLHKGPDSGLVLEYVVELAKRFHVVLVWGNHEEKHMRWLHHEEIRGETGRKNPTRHVGEYLETQDQLTEEHVAFLRGETYPVYMYYQFHNHIVAHGGIPGSLHRLPVSQSLTVDAGLQTSKHEYHKLKQLYRIRYQGIDGNMVSMGEETADDSFWAERYDGRFGLCIFGHQPFSQVAKFPNAYGIDTGCVYGQLLTAYVYHNNDTSEFISVQAKQTYHERKVLMNRNPEEEIPHAD